jgi:hypothetical protein
MRTLLKACGAALVACCFVTSASASKFSDCFKQSLKTGVPVSDCMGTAPAQGAPGRQPDAGGGGDYVAPNAGADASQMVCDISAEPKRSGDWSFNACTIPPRARVVPGGQCACRSRTTGLVYGGVVKGGEPVYNGNPYGQGGGADTGRQQPAICDVSMEPKMSGDWSLQSCASHGNAIAGTQCTCRSKTTQRVYGGVVK